MGCLMRLISWYMQAMIQSLTRLLAPTNTYRLQVLMDMVAGVFAKWRMPVNFVFSQPVTGEIRRRLVILVMFLPASVFFSIAIV